MQEFPSSSSNICYAAFNPNENNVFQYKKKKRKYQEIFHDLLTFLPTLILANHRLITHMTTSIALDLKEIPDSKCT